MSEEIITTVGLDESDWESSDDKSVVDNTSQGKIISLMQPQPLADVHPFVPTLHGWQEGIAADCGDDWEWDVIEETVAWGAHPTACTDDAFSLFADDISYQEKAGLCKVMLWEDQKKLHPKNLKISPVAVVLQVN